MFLLKRVFRSISYFVRWVFCFSIFWIFSIFNDIHHDFVVNLIKLVTIARRNFHSGEASRWWLSLKLAGCGQANTSSELAAGWQLQTQLFRARLLHRDSMGIVLLLTEQNKRHLWKFCFGVPSATFRLSLHVFWNLTNSWDFPEQSLEATLSHIPLFQESELASRWAKKGRRKREKDLSNEY